MLHNTTASVSILILFTHSVSCHVFLPQEFFGEPEQQSYGAVFELRSVFICAL